MLFLLVRVNRTGYFLQYNEKVSRRSRRGSTRKETPEKGRPLALLDYVTLQELAR